ncbi:MAG: GNAT family N-acetyltransferase [Gaiellales bacterium]
MTPQPVIRRLAPAEEAASCAELMAASEPWVTLGRSAEASLRIIQDPSREVFLARQGNDLAGFIILCMVGPFVGYIQTVCVSPDRRGRGLGSLLVAWAEARIFRESPNVFLCVSSFNDGARRLYQRLGYRVVGTLEDYLVPGHGEILLRKSRGPWSQFRPDAQA